MLTFEKTPDGTMIGNVVENNKKTPLYWHPKREEQYLVPPDFDDYMHSKKFRNRYKLTANEIDAIIPAIYEDNPIEKTGLKKKFFKIREDLETSAYTELRLPTNMMFVPQYYPQDRHTWPGTFMVTASSGAGKDYWILHNLIKPNLDGRRANRRRFLYLSAEALVDRTITKSGLRKAKYRNYIDFVDISEAGLRDTQFESKEEFFEKHIMMKIKHLPPGSLIVLNDYMDSVIPHELRKFSDRALRTYRHRQIGVLLVMHSIKSGLFSSQSHNSTKAFVLFPRSSFYKIKQWLREDVNMSPSEIEILNEMRQKDRSVYLHVHTPNYICNSRIIKLF